MEEDSEAKLEQNGVASQILLTEEQVREEQIKAVHARLVERSHGHDNAKKNYFGH